MRGRHAGPERRAREVAGRDPRSPGKGSTRSDPVVGVVFVRDVLDLVRVAFAGLRVLDRFQVVGGDVPRGGHRRRVDGLGREFPPEETVAAGGRLLEGDEVAVVVPVLDQPAPDDLRTSPPPPRPPAERNAVPVRGRGPERVLARRPRPGPRVVREPRRDRTDRPRAPERRVLEDEPRSIRPNDVLGRRSLDAGESARTEYALLQYPRRRYRKRRERSGSAHGSGATAVSRRGVPLRGVLPA